MTKQSSPKRFKTIQHSQRSDTEPIVPHSKGNLRIVNKSKQGQSGVIPKRKSPRGTEHK